MADEKLILNSPDEVVVRMYGQGFGDCFLLAFPRVRAGQAPDPSDPVYVVIDSGVFFLTPGDRERMRAVARSIRESTGGTIDLLVATHEHHDHLCGFEYARDEWQQIGVRRIWLAWTEDATHPATQAYDREKEALKLQSDMALQVLSEYVKRERDQQREPDPIFERELRQITAVVGFAGESVARDDGERAPAGGDAEALAAGEIRPPRRLSKIPDNVLDDFANQPGKRFSQAGPKTERDFCEPGQVRTVPGTAVDAYVLGPPTSEGRLAQELDTGEVYHADGAAEDDAAHAATLAALRQRLQLAASSGRAERESIAAALKRRLGAAGAAEDAADIGAPFPPSLTVPYAAARRHPFFQERYFEARKDRQIETDWLRSVSRLALQVDQVINNTSLVLAFRLPDERVLLFVGDAQVGNWLSWHEIRRRDWRRPEGGRVGYRPTAAELLAQTHVYKVGHHGSHNATLKTRGLEMMADGLIAFVPTSQVFPQRQNDWQIPLDTLTDALWRKSCGQLIFPHVHPRYDYASTEFAKRVEAATEQFAPMEREGTIIEAAVPLWRQVRI